MTERDLPSIESYGQYSGDNYGVHTLQVSIGSIRLYYSYQTIVAFRAPGYGLVISRNVWGTTTGKHLNWIDDDHSRRIPYDEFCERLQAMLSEYVK